MFMVTLRHQYCYYSHFADKTESTQEVKFTGKITVNSEAQSQSQALSDLKSSCFNGHCESLRRGYDMQHS